MNIVPMVRNLHIEAMIVSSSTNASDSDSNEDDNNNNLCIVSGALTSESTSSTSVLQVNGSPVGRAQSSSPDCYPQNEFLQRDTKKYLDRVPMAGAIPKKSHCNECETDDNSMPTSTCLKRECRYRRGGPATASIPSVGVDTTTTIQAGEALPHTDKHSFTPIPPNKPDTDFDNSCRTPPIYSDDRFVHQKSEGDGPMLDLGWDEIFALSEYVRFGYYEQRPSSENLGGDFPNLRSNATKHQEEEQELEEDEDEEEPDENDSSTSSDIFDVFVNPAACSSTDETDESDEPVFSSNEDSESITSCESGDSNDVDTPRPRKSSFLDPRRPRTPPGMPSRKSVRFADALGLELDSVRLILDMDTCLSPPPPPPFASATCSMPLRWSRTSLRPCFEQPGGRPDFLERLHEQKVCVENAVVADMTVMGTIKVVNLSFEKEVRVRYSWDGWNSHANVLAMYVAGSCDGPTDRFSFGFSVPRSYTAVGDKVFFAVFYKVAGQEYWDNNRGRNYLFLVEEDMTRHN